MFRSLRMFIWCHLRICIYFMTYIFILIARNFKLAGFGLEIYRVFQKYKDSFLWNLLIFSSCVWGNIVSKKKVQPSLSLETIIRLATISYCDIALLNTISYKAMKFVIRSDHLPTLPFLNYNNGCESVLVGRSFCSWTRIIAVNFNIFKCIY